MSYTQILDRIGISVDADTAFACEYLELHGYQMCVHFGYANAKRIAAGVAKGKLAGKPLVRYPHELMEGV